MSIPFMKITGNTKELESSYEGTIELSTDIDIKEKKASISISARNVKTSTKLEGDIDITISLGEILKIIEAER